MVWYSTMDRRNLQSIRGVSVNTKRSGLRLAFGGLILVAAPVFAHHATASYDMASVSSVKGTVTRFEWSNPHAYIYIDAKDDKGGTVEWSAEMPSIGMLSRVSWRKDTVKPGDEITIYGNPAKTGKPLMRLEKIVFANGQELSTRAPA
jgi:hypothetical protein